MTGMVQKKPDAQLNDEIRTKLSNFGQLVSTFQFSQLQQQNRCSLLPVLSAGKPFEFGPLTNTNAIINVPSEGEESEIDVTDFLTQNQNHHQQSAQQRSWSVQEVWSSQAPQQQTMHVNLDKLHPHNQKILHGRLQVEEKGGPRIRDVLEQLVDLKSLRSFVSALIHSSLNHLFILVYLDFTKIIAG